MSKIVLAVNTMIMNPDKITNVVQGYTESEIFFIYDAKHKWSIHQGASGVIYLNFYPGDQDIFELALMDEEMWDRMSRRVTYNTKELASKEAVESFKDLHTLVKEKVYGMDEVLDDIISSDIPF